MVSVRRMAAEQLTGGTFRAYCFSKSIKSVIPNGLPLIVLDGENQVRLIGEKDNNGCDGPSADLFTRYKSNSLDQMPIHRQFVCAERLASTICRLSGAGTNKFKLLVQ